MRPRASDEVAVDVSDAPSTSGGDGDLGFWQLLSGREIARPTHPAKGGVRSRVVLLHGWLMSHACWLNTATQLRDRYGHDVLLLDFPGHGRSPLLPEFTDHHPLAFADRLRAVLRRVGWAPARRLDGAAPSIDPIDPEKRFSSKATIDVQNHSVERTPPLVLCGLSLGGVVSCLYADTYPGEVSRVVLVASPGLDEKWYAPPNVSRPLRVSALHLARAVRARGGRLGRWLVSRGCAPVHAALSHLHLVRDTPTFGVPRDMPARLRRAGVPTALVWGALDQFHTAQIRRWKAGRPHARDARLAREQTERTEQTEGERGDERSAATTNFPAPTFSESGKDAGVHILVHPYFDHFAACVFLDALRLAERAHFWHDTHDVPPRVNEVFPPVAGARAARGPAARAKL
jgi:pimeloyl-ACP methyl ester carboxylesterase